MSKLKYGDSIKYFIKTFSHSVIIILAVVLVLLMIPAVIFTPMIIANFIGGLLGLIIGFFILIIEVSLFMTFAVL